jgi:hypothetical protein
MKKGYCNFILDNGNKCNKKTETHKFICDFHADIQEIKPYGRYCEFCGIDTFNIERHKPNCLENDEMSNCKDPNNDILPRKVYKGEGTK